MQLRNSKKLADLLPLRNAGGSVFGSMLCPLRHLAQSNFVFSRIPVNENGEFGQWAGDRAVELVFAELSYRDCDSLVKALGFHIDSMEYTL